MTLQSVWGFLDHFLSLLCQLPVARLRAAVDMLRNSAVAFAAFYFISTWRFDPPHTSVAACYSLEKALAHLVTQNVGLQVHRAKPHTKSIPMRTYIIS